MPARGQRSALNAGLLAPLCHGVLGAPLERVPATDACLPVHAGKARLGTTALLASASDRPQIEWIGSAEPDCTVPMVAQFIVGIGMHEHVERTVIEREPSHDLGKVARRKRNLVAPLWMRSDRSLMKAAHFHDIAKMRAHCLTKLPRGRAAGSVEIDVRMPAPDTRYLEIRHHLSLIVSSKATRLI